MFPGDGKTAFSRQNIWEIGAKWFPLARKSVSTRLSKGIVVKKKLSPPRLSQNRKKLVPMKNWFSLAGKPVSTNKIEWFASKIHFHCMEKR